MTFAIRWLRLAAGLLLARALAGAPDPATGSAEDFFGLTNLHTFHFTIAPEQWAIMEQVEASSGGGAGSGPGGLGGPSGGLRGPGGGAPLTGADYRDGRATLEFDGRPFGSLAVRFKGNSSFKWARHSLKRSLKLDFNDLEKGRTFFGLTKLNLNNNAMDPSQLREALGYEIFRHGGVPAGRTAFARVYVTVPGRHHRAYAGLYTAVEQLDERFLKARFGTKGGLLLKPERVPGLPFLGDDWSAYTNRLQPKTPATAADARRFIEFVRVLNTGDDARFAAAADEAVDVDEFLRFVALQALLANLDSPLLTGHNYYLWLHPESHRFVWLPWDLNEAFGGFTPAGSAGEQLDLSLEHPYSRVNRLAERMLENPRFRERYRAIVRGQLATNFNLARLGPVIDALAATVRPALEGDPTVTLAQFDAALAADAPAAPTGERAVAGGESRRSGPVPGGMSRPRIPIRVFIAERVAAAEKQLAGETAGYVPRDIRPGPNGPRPSGPR